MNGVQTSHSSEAQHGTFSSAKWQVGILGPLVQPAAGFLSGNIANDLHRSTVGAQLKETCFVADHHKNFVQMP